MQTDRHADGHTHIHRHIHTNLQLHTHATAILDGVDNFAQKLVLETFSEQKLILFPTVGPCYAANPALQNDSVVYSLSERLKRFVFEDKRILTVFILKPTILSIKRFKRFFNLRGKT